MKELTTNLSEQLLGHLLSNEMLFFEVNKRITPEIFENGTDILIYKTLSDYLLSGNKLNTVKIAYETKQPEVTLQRIQELINFTNQKTTIESILDLIFVISKQKQLNQFIFDLELDYQTNKARPEKTIEFITHFLTKINEQENGKSIVGLPAHVDNVLKIIERNMTESGMTGVPTGLNDLNRKTNGLQGGDLIILAGETSQGKTSLALTIAAEAGRFGSVHFVTMEMTENQLTSRLMAMDTGYNANRMLTAKMDSADLSFISSECFRTKERNILIDNSANEINDIISNIHRLKAIYNTTLVVIDYLQLIKSNGDGNKEQRVAEVTRRLKNLSIELDLPIILLSQLSRDRDNPYPRLARLRDSGQIEEAADIVIFIYRAEYYGREEFQDGSPSKGRAEMIIAKGRNIGTAVYYLKFDENLTKFSNDESNYPGLD